MKPGAYVITAQPSTDDPNQWGPLATQWFIVSDLGLTALSGHDGVHAIVRSLSTAEPVAGVKLQLIAVNNDILGQAVTDDAGYAHFDPGLARGTGGMAPQLVVAETDSDYAFLDLTRAAFDLTDRGVAGRAAPQALDAFLTPERGIYRPGETVHLTALVRDARANAVTDLPMTLVVERLTASSSCARRSPTAASAAIRRTLRLPPMPCAARGRRSSMPTPRARRSPRPRFWSRTSSRSGWRSNSIPPPRCFRPMRRSPSISRPAISMAPRRRTSPSRAIIDIKAVDSLDGLPGLHLRAQGRHGRALAPAAGNRCGDRRRRQGELRRRPAGAAGDHPPAAGGAGDPRCRYQRPRGRAHAHPADRADCADDRPEAALRRRSRRRRQCPFPGDPRGAGRHTHGQDRHQVEAGAHRKRLSVVSLRRALDL